MNTAYAHALYRELLYERGHGYPFWIPEPSDALPKEQKAEGVRLGDVGILTDDGGFEYLWNVHLPSDHPYNKSRVPSNFTPLAPLNETLDIRRIDPFHPVDTAICSTGVKKQEITLTAELKPAIVGGVVGGGAGFEFSTEGNSGAILTLPRGGVRVDAVKRDLYQKYAACHAESWFRYINEEQMRGVQSGTLFLVTGTDKCSSWGVASFTKPSGSKSLSLKFSASDAASLDAAVKSSWSTDHGVEHRAKVVDPSELSQCVFARGFVISVRDRLWAPILGMSVKTKSLYGSNGRPSFANSSRPFSRGAESNPDVHVQQVPDRPSHKSPAALLADELLNRNDGASFAIVHDQDWIASTRHGDLLRTRDQEDSVLETLIKHAAAHSHTVVVDGVCTVVDADVATLSVTPVADGTSGAATGDASARVDKVANALSHIQQRGSSQTAQVASSENIVGYPEVRPTTLNARQRLFALIIGIDVYEHSGPAFYNLEGAVADADDMLDFLTTTLSVDRSHIINLRNQEATLDRIINAFATLTSDGRIQCGDPIVIFFAGHGSQTSVPREWETVVPEKRMGMLLPYNFFPKTTPTLERQGLLDIMLRDLLRKLAEQKGDNITVIIDACRAGGFTLRRHRDVPYSPDPNLNLRPFRSIDLPDDYTILPSSLMYRPEVDLPCSYVQLSACWDYGMAYEYNGRGAFTLALLTLLRDANACNLTYVDVIGQLEDLAGQHPQCEIMDQNSARTLFGWILYPVKVTQMEGQDDIITLGRGEVHGITAGTEFDVFATKAFNARPLCRLVATVTHEHSSDLAPVAGSLEHGIPQPAWAQPCRTVKPHNDYYYHSDFVVALSPASAFLHVLKIAAEMGQRPNKRTIRFVEPDVTHEFELRINDDRVVFIITDKLCTDAGSSQLSNTVSVNDAPAMYAVIEAAANFFFHLRRSNPAPSLAEKLILEGFELRDRDDAKQSAFSVAPSSANLVEGGLMQLEITEEKPGYAFKLVNGWSRDLYIWAFMFNVSDLDVETLYKPNLSNLHPDPSLPAHGSLTFGYGSNPVVFFLPEGTNVDVSYLKVYVMSEPVDLSYIAQNSPFERGVEWKTKERKVVQLPVWDSLLVAIVQKAAV